MNLCISAVSVLFEKKSILLFNRTSDSVRSFKETNLIECSPILTLLTERNFFNVKTFIAYKKLTLGKKANNLYS